MRLYGIPEAISAAVCAFPSIAAAVDTVILTIQSGVPVARSDGRVVRGSITSHSMPSAASACSSHQDGSRGSTVK